MKIRNGFVSNSSSASFMVKLKDITHEQLHQIVDHSEVSQEIAKNDAEYASEQDDDGWETVHISYEYGNLMCFTMMDNFDMRLFLGKIGVDLSKVKFDDQHNYDDGDYDEEGGENGWSKLPGE